MSSDQGEGVTPRIAVNAMRARLTLLGFNLAIVTFQLAGLPRRTGGAPIPGLEYNLHVAPGVVLLVGAALSFVAMIMFVASGRLDERGDCTHWSLLLGDVLMYVAMAHTISGLFGPMLRDLETARVEGTPAGPLFDDLRIAIALVGGVAWTCAAYLGPIVSLLRSPFGRAATVGVGVFYVVMLLAQATIWRLAGKTEMALGVGQSRSCLWGFAVPLCW